MCGFLNLQQKGILPSKNSFFMICKKDEKKRHVMRNKKRWENCIRVSLRILSSFYLSCFPAERIKCINKKTITGITLNYLLDMRRNGMMSGHESHSKSLTHQGIMHWIIMLPLFHDYTPRVASSLLAFFSCRHQSNLFKQRAGHRDDDHHLTCGRVFMITLVQNVSRLSWGVFFYQVYR